MKASRRRALGLPRRLCHPAARRVQRAALGTLLGRDRDRVERATTLPFCVMK
jgi:hypothetical protein